MLSLLPLILACSGENDSPDTQTSAGDSGAHDTAQTVPRDPRFDDLADLLKSELAKNEALAVSVAVYENGEVIHAEAHGSQDIAGELEVDTDTLFQLGSVTKMFTAVGLLQSTESNQLPLATTLSEVYPESEFALNSTWNDGIQLEHLLTHESGMFNWFGTQTSPSDGYLQTWFEEVYFRYAWLMNPSGLFYNYTNPGYMMAGLVMELLDEDERAYADLMKEDVFQPLGMERTYVRKREANRDGHFAESRGYLVNSDGSSTYTTISMSDLPEQSHARPAGSGTWSTPTQMMAMADFLLNGNPDVLEDSVREQMTQKQVDIHSTPFEINYGYGYGITTMDGIVLGETYYPETIWNHDGATGSFSATFWVLPEKNVAFCILNSGYGTSFEETLQRLLLEFLEPDGDANPEIPMKEHDASQIPFRVGTYLDDPNFGEVIIRLEDDELKVSMPRIDELGFSYNPTLFMDRDDHWYIQIEGIWNSWLFWGEDNAPSDYIVSRNMVATRVPENPSVQSSTRSGPTREQFQSFLNQSPSEIPPLLQRLPPATRSR
ncbi:MAG: serine hydrolase domain-containing protein [Myxococcota bacterium]|nr:serine hydrolase domain-containing protein [Myxococcota bacterium]